MISTVLRPYTLLTAPLQQTYQYAHFTEKTVDFLKVTENGKIRELKLWQSIFQNHGFNHYASGSGEILKLSVDP